MTAYGRAYSEEIEGTSVVIELHSVNRKGLDLRVHLPKELLFLDLDIRKKLGQQLVRGQVTVKLTFKEGKEKKGSVALLKKLKTEWESKASELGYAKEVVDFPFLLGQTERFSFEELGFGEEKIKQLVMTTLDDVLAQFIEMREVEGKALAEDVTKRLSLLSQMADKIEKESEKGPEIYRETLLEKLKEILSEAERDERIFKEVALFAEKIDTTEEIIRLRSHLKQAENLFTSKEKSIGRTLDFLVQEMGREVNTIGSKTHQLSVTEQTVLAKQELEKIREQGHNIE